MTPTAGPDSGLRLNDPAIRPNAPAVEISFDGETVTAYEGESLAAALVAAGWIVQRTTSKGQPRGVFCGMGVCHDCLVTVDGQASRRACMTKVRAAMRVESQKDGLAVPDLDAPPLADLPEGPLPRRTCQVLVIGAGPGGLAGAEAVAEAGASVVLVDERPGPGGQFFKQLATSHGFRSPAARDAQFAQGARLIEKVRDLGVEVVSQATVWGGFRDGENGVTVGVYQDRKAWLFRAQQTIIATGAYERPVPLPGWTLPGFMTTGAVQTLARSDRVAPGRRILVAGNGPLNLQVACELLRGGARVLAVVEAADAPIRRWRAGARALWHGPGLVRQGLEYLRLLKQRGVPVLYRHALIRLEGESRVERAVVARIDEKGYPVAGSEAVFEADAVCAGYGFLPANELARLLGCAHEPVDRGLGNLVTTRDRNGETSIPGVFVVGEAGAIGGAQIALAQGRLAGYKAAENLARSVPSAKRKAARRALSRHRRFQDAIWSLYHAPTFGLQLARDDTVICRCEEVTLGQLRPLIASGVTGLGELKRLTRAGMGRCQGRYCSLSLTRLAAEPQGARPDEFGGFTPQTPIKPVPLAALAVEKPEWSGHVPVTLPAPRGAVSGPDGGIDETEVLVIGAGILGASTAYYLARQGVDVLVVDRGGVNSGASGGNAGSLHVQLLSYDVGVKEASGTAPILGLLPLQKLAIGQWRELEDALGADFEIKVTGGLMLAESEQSLNFLEAKAKLERSHGIQVEVIGADELRRLEPALADRFLGAAWCPEEGKINPLLATPAVMEAAVKAGARLHQHREITAIERDRGGFVAHSDQGRVRAGKVVSAAGAWSAQIAGMLGVTLPVQVTPMQMIVTEPAAPLVTRLVAHADRHLTMKQAASGHVIIGGGWTAGLDPSSGRPRVLQDSLEGNLWVARRVVPALAHLRVLRSWAAFSVDADGAPILGAVPGLPGFYLAVTTNGYTLGPTVGRLMAELVTSGRSDFDLTPYAVDRFF